MNLKQRKKYIKLLKINTLITLIFVLSSPKLHSQIFDYEQANPNINWKQINTEHFRLIFPEPFSSKANKVANTLSIQLRTTNETFDRKPRKIDIIIQENTLDQNGFVQLAPRKSELYSTPSSIADNQSWLTNLSLHEMRHVSQFDNLTGKIRKPYGEQIALGLFALNLPSWYFEGDAVLYETLLSKGGRGRLSSWNMPLRANIQSNANYDFNKYTHGSYKDIVPSYYTIGYFMNSELYQKDSKITGYIYEDMRGRLLRPFNFQLALKKYYGTNANNLFKNTISNLENCWSTKPQNIYPNRITFHDKYPTDYLLPQLQHKDIFAIRQGPQKVNAIVKINSESQASYKEIIKTGTQLMPYFDIKDSLIVWDEYRRNARYSKETFNVINVYNIHSRKRRTITHETRYYTPVLSPDLKNIACVEVDEANNSYLTIIETYSDKKVKSIAIPDGIHIQQPKYNALGDKIIAIAVSEQGTSLIEINLHNQDNKILIPWDNQQIERPIYQGKDIIFKSNLGNKDDIFKLSDGQIHKLTDAEFGAFNPFIINEKLYFNDYTTDGYKINSFNINELKAIPVTMEKIPTLYATQNNFTIAESDSITDIQYAVENYTPLTHTVNFHSISLSGNDFENLDNLKPGIFFLSNDELNTTQIKLGLEYDTNIKKTTYSAELSYQKYYPKITIGYKNRGEMGFAASKSNKDSIYRFDYRENVLTADIQLPFTKYRGNKIYSYGFNFGTSYQHRYDLTLPLQNFNTDIILPLNYQVYFNINSRRSRMDLFPKWGQNFSFLYRHLPFENDLSGTAWSFRSSFYFPGLLTNHGIQLRYAMQKNTGKFSSSNDIPLISGISYMLYKKIDNTLTLDYRLPLAYPDLSIGQLAYIKRIYGSVAAGYLNLQDTNMKPKAISASLFVDFNMFKYTLPNFCFETKVSYLTPTHVSKRIFPEFSFSYNY